MCAEFIVRICELQKSEVKKFVSVQKFRAHFYLNVVFILCFIIFLDEEFQ